jgi:hypothetical protein
MITEKNDFLDFFLTREIDVWELQFIGRFDGDIFSELWSEICFDLDIEIRGRLDIEFANEIDPSPFL